MKTEQSRYVFAVKEGSGGQPWIMLEPVRDNLAILENGFLGLTLPEGTTYERAQEIARYLSDNIMGVLHHQF
jgi:hypothetical protein